VVRQLTGVFVIAIVVHRAAILTGGSTYAIPSLVVAGVCGAVIAVIAALRSVAAVALSAHVDSACCSEQMDGQGMSEIRKKHTSMRQVASYSGEATYRGFHHCNRDPPGSSQGQADADRSP
jgi:hypothetical protein